MRIPLGIPEDWGKDVVSSWRVLPRMTRSVLTPNAPGPQDKLRKHLLDIHKATV